MAEQRTTDAPAATALSPRRRTAALAVLLAGLCMDVLDSSIVYITLPTIQDDLGASGAQLQWVAVGYTLPFALGIITASRLGDAFGRRGVFLTGMLLFALTSVLCGLAGSPEVLVAGRVAQGLAAALMVPQIMATIQVMYPPGERGLPIAAASGVFAVSNVLGPVVGGLLLHLDVAGLGWRMIFLVNVPICAAALVGTLVLVPRSRSAEATRLDLPGAALVTAALVSLLYPLIVGAEAGWPGWSLGLLALSVPLFALFALHQSRRATAPLVPLVLFGRRSFTGGLLVILVCMGGVSGFSLVFTLFLQTGLGFTPLTTALTQLSWGVVTAVAAVLSVTVLAPRFGRRTLDIGLAVTAVGMGGLVALVTTADGPLGPWAFVLPLALAGAGMGLVLAPVVDYTLHDVPLEDAGAASGVLNTFQQVSIATGVALIGAVYFLLLPVGEAGTAEVTRAFAHTLWLPFLLITLVGFAAVRLLPRSAALTPTDTGEPPTAPSPADPTAPTG